jgi:hypothetical protein
LPVKSTDNWKLATDNYDGAVAQLGEHLVCNQGVSGSIPLSSTKIFRRAGQETSMESIMSLGPFLIPITAILVGGVVTIVVLVLRHQERIAKIEHGIDPDRIQR